MLKNRWLKNAGNILSNILLVALTAVALLLTFFLLQNKFTGSEPSLAGYRICVVMSGSMEPAVKVGSVVLVQPLEADNVRPGDIITFRGNSKDSLTTHRVDHLSTENGLLFHTKGDANNTLDPLPATPQNLMGKVAFTIPFLGYLLFYIRTLEGLLTLLALVVIIISGGLIRRYREKKNKAQAIRRQGGGRRTRAQGPKH